MAKIVVLQDTPHGSIEVEMASPERWCPACDQIRSPLKCARILPGGDDDKRCGTPTIHHTDLDPATRARFDERKRQLLNTRKPSA